MSNALQDYKKAKQQSHETPFAQAVDNFTGNLGNSLYNGIRNTTMGFDQFFHIPDDRIPQPPQTPISPLAQTGQNVLSAYTALNPAGGLRSRAQVSPTPTPQPQGVGPNITIPYSQGGQYTLPAGLAQNLLNNFNATGEATHAAQILNHPLSQTYTQQEQQQMGHPSYNYGENASFQPVKDSTNSDGSTDRGLFRINSNTFTGYMSNPHSRAILGQNGINSYEDMNDPQKNAFFASLLLLIRGWQPWYAAPLPLRKGNYTGTGAITKF